MVEAKQIPITAALKQPGIWSPSIYFHYALLATALLLFSGIRWRLRDMPLQRDEGEYAYAGELLLQGIPSYEFAYSMKLPGTYAAYAVILSVFGQTPAGVHSGLLLLNAATTLFLFAITSRLVDTSAGVVAGISYVLLSSCRAVMGFQAHATHFVIFFALAGIGVLLEGLDRKSTWLLWTSGILLGAAFLMKQHGIFFVGFGTLYLLIRGYRQGLSLRSMLWTIAALVVGACLPIALTLVAVLRLGGFAKFWFWTFKYAHQYTAANTLAEGWHNLLTKSHVVHPFEWMWMIGLIGLSACLWDPIARSKADFILPLTFFSCLSICPGFLFRAHYFILLLPAVALLIGLAVSSTSRWLAGNAAVWAKTLPSLLSLFLTVLPWAAFLLAYSYSMVRENALLFRMDPVTASRESFGFPEALSAASFIQQHSRADARVAVLGSEPEIYFYCQRLSATGYIYTYPLMEKQVYAPMMQREMISEIETVQPQFIVLVYARDSWGRQASSDDTIFKWADAYLRQGYRLAATVSPPSNPYLPGPAIRAVSATPALLYIFQRGKSDSPQLVPKLTDFVTFGN
jgi:hypothetical protein